MKTQIPLSDAIGKTLEAFEFSFCCAGAVLVFTDGTFAALGIERGYEHCDDKIAEDTLSVFEFGDDKLISAGITTAEELAEMRDAADRRARAMVQERQEQHDRAEFERLKAKFGQD